MKKFTVVFRVRLKIKKNQTLNKKNEEKRPKKQIKELKEPKNDNSSDGRVLIRAESFGRNLIATDF